MVRSEELTAKFQENESTFGADYFRRWPLLSLGTYIMGKIAAKLI